jgi:glucans biosynthesis protein C
LRDSERDVCSFSALEDRVDRSSTLGSATTIEGAEPRSTTPRLVFLDNIKLALTALVIVHHVAMTYGAEGAWYYSEPPSTPVAQLVLTVFNTVNQSYFMGLFFFISGYFTPGSYDRKGTWGFFKDRLLRLGAPLLVFSLFVSPLLERVKAANRGIGEVTYRTLLQDNFRQLPDPGPLWFIETLLVFSVLYAVVRHWTTASSPANPPRFSHGAIGAFALLMGSLSFIVRIFFPSGVEVAYVQLAFFPQYMLLFVAGLAVSRHGWLLNWPRQLIGVWFPIVLGAFTSGMILVFTRGGIENKDLFLGGFHWEALTFAIIESIQCVAICVCLVSISRTRFNRQNAFVRALNEDAYAVYIIHAPLIVCLAYWLRAVSMDSLLKFALVATLAVPLCFLTSRLLRRVPLADRIL